MQQTDLDHCTPTDLKFLSTNAALCALALRSAAKRRAGAATLSACSRRALVKPSRDGLVKKMNERIQGALCSLTKISICLSRAMARNGLMTQICKRPQGTYFWYESLQRNKVRFLGSVTKMSMRLSRVSGRERFVEDVKEKFEGRLHGSLVRC